MAKNNNIVSVQLTTDQKANFDFIRKMKGESASEYLRELIDDAIEKDLQKIKELFKEEEE